MASKLVSAVRPSDREHGKVNSSQPSKPKPKPRWAVVGKLCRAKDDAERNRLEIRGVYEGYVIVKNKAGTGKTKYGRDFYGSLDFTNAVGIYPPRKRSPKGQHGS